MNKLLIILLAICLVSVHAFVKRDAPATDAKPGLDLEEFGNKITEWGKTAGEQLKKAFDPKKIQEDFNNLKEEIEKITSPKKE